MPENLRYTSFVRRFLIHGYLLFQMISIKSIFSANPNFINDRNFWIVVVELRFLTDSIYSFLRWIEYWNETNLSSRFRQICNFCYIDNLILGRLLAAILPIILVLILTLIIVIYLYLGKLKCYFSLDKWLSLNRNSSKEVLLYAKVGLF